MKGDGIIIKFISSSYALGIAMFIFYAMFVLTHNEIYFFAVIILLGLTPIAFLRYDSKHLILRITEKNREEWK